jgi:uncharacterized protein YqjF (DUF2071 family)
MPKAERPFLRARWTELLLLNFAVPSDLISSLAPPGTEPDLFDEQAYISVVGFRFRDTRIRGWALPGHRDFLEINLRYYVRRYVGDDEIRRGVVFASEIVPRRLVAIVANRVYHEKYVCRPMRSELCIAGPDLAIGDRISYHWQSRVKQERRWNGLTARVGSIPQLPPPGSLQEFIVEHYWGYATGRDGRTREYRVAHPPWRVAAADEVLWDCDATTNYSMPLAKYLAGPPASAVIAEGSAVEVYPGRML